ncbi:ribose transport system permease protein [Actinocorallia herbida]|uniref:Ribose transport system permease protein n=1 Tax=Actinocorallia herbida TaxID=58109 RepID=A0A3N1D0Y7_9ACTN|nr:ABC transporter permease [Actinocorallia herbida]ROO87192.1 ribose transport system permease protein [Actinocorallia herbida]
MADPLTETAPAARSSTAPTRGIPSRFAVIGVWFALCILYGLLKPELFLTVPTFQTIFGSQQPLVFLTMALLCTIIVGEFVDLSVAPLLGLAATIVPVLTVLHGWHIWLSCLVAIAATVLVGAVNGALVVFVGVNTIVVTLGMGTLVGGLALWMSDMNQVSGLDPEFAELALTKVAGLPVSFFYGLVLVSVFTYVLGWTPLGRHLRFVGANREVARLAGIGVNRVRFGSFVASGLLCGLGGVIAVAGLGGFNPTVSATYLLPTFAATFLGTAVIQPGRFNPVGTFIGIYFLATGILGLQLMGVPGWVSDVFYGGVLVVAVSLSTVLARRR